MNNLLIFGVGLIGGSIAIECQKKQMFNHVVGVQREGGTSLSPFVSSGMIDRVSDSLEDDIKQADFIVIATPVAQIRNILMTISPSLSTKIIVIDGCRRKANCSRCA